MFTAIGSAPVCPGVNCGILLRGPRPDLHLSRREKKQFWHPTQKFISITIFYPGSSSAIQTASGTSKMVEIGEGFLLFFTSGVGLDDLQLRCDGCESWAVGWWKIIRVWDGVTDSATSGSNGDNSSPAASSSSFSATFISLFLFFIHLLFFLVLLYGFRSSRHWAIGCSPRKLHATKQLHGQSI